MSDSAPKRSRKPATKPAAKPAARRPAKRASTSASERAGKSASATASVPHDEVARRAYEKYAARGFTHGQDGDDWLQAEKELEAELAESPRRSRAKTSR